MKVKGQKQPLHEKNCSSFFSQIFWYYLFIFRISLFVLLPKIAISIRNQKNCKRTANCPFRQSLGIFFGISATNLRERTLICKLFQKTQKRQQQKNEQNRFHSRL